MPYIYHARWTDIIDKHLLALNICDNIPADESLTEQDPWQGTNQQLKGMFFLKTSQ